MSRLKQPNWTRILTILLVILAVYALVYITGSIIFRFKQALLLFILGGMTAYILSPLVNRLEQAFRVRWLAILLAYFVIAISLFSLGVMLVTPFIQQAQSLVDNLHNPSASSLQAIKLTESDAVLLSRQLKCLQTSSTTGFCFQYRQDRQRLPDLVRIQIDKLQAELQNVKKGTVSGPSHYVNRSEHLPPGRVPPNPQPQTQVPTSYISMVQQPLSAVSSNYLLALGGGSLIVDPFSLGKAVTEADRASAAASQMYHIMSTTPILLIRSQAWLDQHGVKVDLHSRFGDLASQISDQGTIILDNSITIVSETVNILLNITLILIISFYLLNDGRRLVHGAVGLIPPSYREQGWFFVTSLDRVVGGYLRGQILLSTLAGVLGGGGAAVLGVPYPLLIGIITFLLELIPVIGPMVVYIPPLVISLFFMPLTTTIELIVWFIIFQQIVTNVLGPRIMGMAVGIHPLEALFAVLVGYPLAGFLGAFLAVPVMGVLHILIREAYSYFVLGRAAPSAEVPPGVDAIAEPGSPGPQPISPRAKPDSAAG